MSISGLEFDGDDCSGFQVDEGAKNIIIPEDGTIPDGKVAGTWDTTQEVDKTANIVLRFKVEPSPYSHHSSPNTVTTDNIQVTITAPSEGAKFTFSTATPGVCTINGTATATPSEQTPNIYWTLQDMIGSTESYNPTDRKGGTMEMKYTTLPSSNGQFGNKSIKAEIQGQDAEDTKTVKIFFPRDAANNPGGTLPNWYYYWDQFTGEGTHEYDPNLGTDGAYTYGENHFDIGPSAKDQDGGHYVNGDGVDNFASTCLHEDAHMDYYFDEWNPYDPDADQDPRPQGGGPGTGGNGDYMRDSTEANYGFDPNDWDSDDDGCEDEEDRASSVEATWVEGSVDNQDWANPGHQY